jgi:hypothetical protein
MVDVIKLPISTTQDADDHARADTERTRRLFAWADGVIKQIGLDRAAKAISALSRSSA